MDLSKLMLNIKTKYMYIGYNFKENNILSKNKKKVKQIIKQIS